MTAAEAHAAAAAEGLALLRADNAAGFKGVTHNAHTLKPFKAQAWQGGRVNSLGSFATAEEAALVVARSLAAAAEAAAAPSTPARPKAAPRAKAAPPAPELSAGEPSERRSSARVRARPAAAAESPPPPSTKRRRGASAAVEPDPAAAVAAMQAAAAAAALQAEEAAATAAAPTESDRRRARVDAGAERVAAATVSREAGEAGVVLYESEEAEEAVAPDDAMLALALPDTELAELVDPKENPDLSLTLLCVRRLRQKQAVEPGAFNSEPWAAYYQEILNKLQAKFDAAGGYEAFAKGVVEKRRRWKRRPGVRSTKITVDVPVGERPPVYEPACESSA
jgi:hypothetical protein